MYYKSWLKLKCNSVLDNSITKLANDILDSRKEEEFDLKDKNSSPYRNSPYNHFHTKNPNYPNFESVL